MTDEKELVGILGRNTQPSIFSFIVSNMACFSQKETLHYAVNQGLKVSLKDQKISFMPYYSYAGKTSELEIQQNF